METSGSKEKAIRLAPHIAAYRQKLGELSVPPDLRVEFKDPEHREQGWKMSLTDGMPIPDDVVE